MRDPLIVAQNPVGVLLRLFHHFLDESGIVASLALEHMVIDDTIEVVCRALFAFHRAVITHIARHVQVPDGESDQVFNLIKEPSCEMESFQVKNQYIWQFRNARLNYRRC